ncbi:MAG TPA: efflux RND transporter periplasmic adaptor subunit [Bryobacteraceae bacterium]|nr:efflux RND transporter periplasmic adaptor subunit [Bryobacteraceae bacterium]
MHRLPSFTTFVVGIALLSSACRQQKVQSGGFVPVVPVSVAPVVQASIPIQIQAIGRVEPSAVIQVRSQVTGEITRVAFAEGADVAKDQLLFEIDPRPYQEELRQAEATQARDTAQLRQAQANLAKDQAQLKSAEADDERNRELAKEGLASTSQRDQSTAAAEALRASIAADQAAIESARAAIDNDRAAVDKAKLDLVYCHIYAPVSGRAGNLLIHLGNLVGNNGNPLVVINRLNPIWVSFNAPELYLSEIRRGFAEHKLPVRAIPRDDAAHPADGYLDVIDNTVDTNTGTIHLKATFDNRAGQLYPGQFADVTMTLGTISQAVVVPAAAVEPGADGQMVYVVNKDQTVQPRPVTVGTNFGDKVTITKGLAAGETVVTDGQLRLFPGARIREVPASQVDSKSL